eukprot:s883_g5.t1
MDPLGKKPDPQNSKTYQDVHNLNRETLITLAKTYMRTGAPGGKPVSFLTADQVSHRLLQNLFARCSGRPIWYKVQSNARVPIYTFWRPDSSAWISPALPAGTELMLSQWDDDWLRVIAAEEEEDRYIPSRYIRTAALQNVGDVIRTPLQTSKADAKNLRPDVVDNILRKASSDALRCWAVYIKSAKPALMQEVIKEAWRTENERAAYADTSRQNNVLGPSRAISEVDGYEVPIGFFSKKCVRKFLVKHYDDWSKWLETNSSDKNAFHAIFRRGKSSRIKLEATRNREVAVAKTSSVQYDVAQVIRVLKARIRGSTADASSMTSYLRRKEACEQCVSWGLAFCDRQEAADAMLKGGHVVEMDACEPRTTINKARCKDFFWNTPDSGSLFVQAVCPCYKAVSGNQIYPRWITSSAHPAGMPPTQQESSASSNPAAMTGETSYQQLPWAAIPKFIPGTTDVTEYSKKLEFLAAMWPKESLSLLAPRAALLCEGSAFKKVTSLAPEKLKANDESGVKLLVDTLGGSWGRTAIEQKYDTFEKAIFGTIQKADETNDSYLARHDIHFEELLAQGVSFEEVRAYILLRQSSLTSEDRKRIVVELDGKLSYKKVCASVRLLGSRFFADLQGQRGTMKTKTYDANFVEDAGPDDAERAYQAHTLPQLEEPEPELDAEFIEAMVAVEDQDAMQVQAFEEELEGFFQDTPELQEALVSYLEARSRLLAKRKARGFWPAQGSKGFKGGKGFKGKGKGKSAKEQLLQRIAKSHCRACGERGHWKAECPKFGKPGSKTEAQTTVAQATVTQVQTEHGDEILAELPDGSITLAEAFCTTATQRWGNALD